MSFNNIDFSTICSIVEGADFSNLRKSRVWEVRTHHSTLSMIISMESIRKS